LQAVAGSPAGLASRKRKRRLLVEERRGEERRGEERREIRIAAEE
jgi:hypothetical protein